MSQHVAKVCILDSLTKSLQMFLIYFEKINLMKMMGYKKEKDPSPLLGKEPFISIDNWVECSHKEGCREEGKAWATSDSDSSS